jgi:hypothetical protein
MHVDMVISLQESPQANLLSRISKSVTNLIWPFSVFESQYINAQCFHLTRQTADKTANIEPYYEFI